MYKHTFYYFLGDKKYPEIYILLLEDDVRHPADQVDGLSLITTPRHHVSQRIVDCHEKKEYPKGNRCRKRDPKINHKKKGKETHSLV